MICSKGSLEHRPREQHPLWCGAVGISPPRVEQTLLPRTVLLTRTTNTEMDTVMRQETNTKKYTNTALFNPAGSLSLNALTLSASPSLNVPHVPAVAFVTVDDCPVRERVPNDFRC